MKISLNKAHFPVTVLGPGRRIGLWVQGCSIGCKGCISQDTWPEDASKEMSIDDLLAWCEQISGNALDGITISGGEPFDQPLALEHLLRGLARWRERRKLNFDILSYSGYPLATLRSRHAALLGKLDALIAEPYVDAMPSLHSWFGSSNQKLVPLSKRGEQRYKSSQDTAAQTSGKRIQALVDGQRVWYVGIPSRGDMAQLEELCRARGVDFAQVSWRS
ncbi:4Fe-4S single cluster domain-containing protein [Ottowia thiooxydans]|uniref:4Fe-4S single cluster domain-containing protein n=1 Tax=Ottowia thiooxydans TaxID=219182 RepID=UPI0004176D2E|nr:4Fe-4S single cluster domain-containing protein [Ottowia thiooxydans]